MLIKINNYKDKKKNLVILNLYFIVRFIYVEILINIYFLYIKLINLFNNFYSHKINLLLNN